MLVDIDYQSYTFIIEIEKPNFLGIPLINNFIGGPRYYWDLWRDYQADYQILHLFAEPIIDA